MKGRVVDYIILGIGLVLAVVCLYLGISCKEPKIRSEWVVAAATMVYTTITILLWKITERSVKNTNELSKLNLIFILSNIYKPTYGMSPDEYNKWYKERRPKIKKLFEDLKLEEIFSSESQKTLRTLLEGINSHKK